MFSHVETIWANVREALTVATRSGVILRAASGSSGVLYRLTGKIAKRFAGLPPFSVTFFCQPPLFRKMRKQKKGWHFAHPLT